MVGLIIPIVEMRKLRLKKAHQSRSAEGSRQAVCVCRVCRVYRVHLARGGGSLSPGLCTPWRFLWGVHLRRPESWE